MHFSDGKKILIAKKNLPLSLGPIPLRSGPAWPSSPPSPPSRCGPARRPRPSRRFPATACFAPRRPSRPSGSPRRTLRERLGRRRSAEWDPLARRPKKTASLLHLARSLSPTPPRRHRRPSKPPASLHRGEPSPSLFPRARPGSLPPCATCPRSPTPAMAQPCARPQRGSPARGAARSPPTRPAPGHGAAARVRPPFPARPPVTSARLGHGGRSSAVASGAIPGVLRSTPARDRHRRGRSSCGTRLWARDPAPARRSSPSRPCPGRWRAAMAPSRHRRGAQPCPARWPARVARPRGLPAAALGAVCSRGSPATSRRGAPPGVPARLRQPARLARGGLRGAWQAVHDVFVAATRSRAQQRSAASFARSRSLFGRATLKRHA
jgi:hypothetical protein